MLCCQLLKGVTIASGGVLPNIHPELLAKKRGTKGKLEAIITPLPAKKAKTTSPKKLTSKKPGAKKGVRKFKVRTHYWSNNITCMVILRTCKI